MRSFQPDLRENDLRNTEGGLSQLSDGIIEYDESGLIGFIEYGQGARNLQPSTNGFLASCLLIDQDHFGSHFGRERDCLALSLVELCEG